MFKQKSVCMISSAILCLYVMISLSGCVYHSGGARVFDATASTEVGKKFVKIYNVKYICKEVRGLFWTDFYRSKEGIYAVGVTIDIKEKSPESLKLKGKFWDFWEKQDKFMDKIGSKLGLREREIRYISIKQEYVEKLGLKPKFSWWDRFGCFVLIGTVIIIAIVWLIRYKKRYPY